jgi:phosphate transport system permease protein
MSSEHESRAQKHLHHRRRTGKVFAFLCAFSAVFAVFLLGVLLFDILCDGLPTLTMSFINSYPSRFPDQAGIKAALWGSLWLIVLTIAMSVPVGVAASIYLEEFAKRNRFNRFVQLNISNLAGVPSIVYGLLGLTIFVRGFALGRSVLAGALTMALLVLPTIIIAAQEALRAVPNSIRQAALAVGATRWQAVRDHVLPSALPGILTGVILAVSRAMGETAPLITIGALTYVAFIPKGPMDAFTALPIQIFNWASRPQSGFHAIAASGIVVLLAVLLTLNATAIILRQKYERRQRW